MIIKGNRVWFVYVPCHLLSQPEKGKLNAEFGGAGIIIHHVCTLTLLDFHSLGPYLKLWGFFFYFLLPEELFYTVYIYSSSLKKKFRYDFVCAQFQFPILPLRFFGEGLQDVAWRRNRLCS